MNYALLIAGFLLGWLFADLFRFFYRRARIARGLALSAQHVTTHKTEPPKQEKP